MGSLTENDAHFSCKNIDLTADESTMLFYTYWLCTHSNVFSSVQSSSERDRSHVIHVYTQITVYLEELWGDLELVCRDRPRAARPRGRAKELLTEYLAAIFTIGCRLFGDGYCRLTGSTASSPSLS